MRLLRLVVSALLLLVATPFALAQQPASGRPDLSIEAKLVIVPATVRDKKGALVGSLKKEDFALEVDGKPQTIRYFDYDSNVPLTFGLLIDTSMSQRAVLDEERAASSAFMDKMLAPGRDKAFVEQFARQVELLQDVTDSRPKLQQALKEVESTKPSFQQRGNGGDGSGDDDRRGRMRDMLANAGTALYDAVFLASDEVLAKQKGRRAVVVLTDGVDFGSRVSLPRAIEAAQRADTIVYAIYYKGEQPRFQRQGGGFPGGGRRGGGGGRFPFVGDGQYGGGGQRGGRGGGIEVDGKKILERLCGETGGQVFEVTKKQTVDAIYTQIGDALRAQYRLGFTPTGDAGSDEGYHRISLALTGAEAKSKDSVQTRDGYYTGAEKR